MKVSLYSRKRKLVLGLKELVVAVVKMARKVKNEKNVQKRKLLGGGVSWWWCEVKMAGKWREKSEMRK